MNHWFTVTTTQSCTCIRNMGRVRHRRLKDLSYKWVRTLACLCSYRCTCINICLSCIEAIYKQPFAQQISLYNPINVTNMWKITNTWGKGYFRRVCWVPVELYFGRSTIQMLSTLFNMLALRRDDEERIGSQFRTIFQIAGIIDHPLSFYS